MRRAIGALAILSTLVGAGCSAPETRVARRYLRCVGESDLACLRRYVAPVFPRLRAWEASGSAGDLFIGPYARKALLDADNLFAALSPPDCQTVASAGVDRELTRRLRECACEIAHREALPDVELRRARFEPPRVAAGKRHPALEVLTNRTTAEALRASRLSRLRCECGGRTLILGMVELEGRESPLRIFQAAGLCAPAEPSAFDAIFEEARRLFSGELRLSAPKGR